MNIQQLKKVHFVGIGGIGISYLAHFCLQNGINVSGSDLNQSIITDQLAKAGATIFKGHATKHISEDVDLVVYNDAIPLDNEEILFAESIGVETMTNFQLVGELSKDYKTVVVAGNKGKTTTTAMISHCLALLGCDPTAMVGSIVNDWKCNYRKGESNLLIVEGDEFKRHFLQIHADVLVLTNLEPDHLDYYETEQAYYGAFQQLIDRLPNDGLVVYNAEDQNIRDQLNLAGKKLISFSYLDLDGPVAFVAEDYQVKAGSVSFKVKTNNGEEAHCSLQHPGIFNVKNALSAIATIKQLFPDIALEKITDTMSSFAGTWRRFQILGGYNQTTVISDYAHHPSAVHVTIEAAKEFYEGRRIVAVFQAHTRHRTKALFDDFVMSFDKADLVIIPDIFDVAGREVISDEEMNAEILANAINERGKVDRAYASGDLQATLAMLDNYLRKDDVLLMMGAGDIYTLAEQMVGNPYDLFELEFGDIIKTNEPLKKYTTFKLGGNAKYLVEPKTSDQLIEVFRFVRKHNLNYFILGGGANILMPDSGFDGIVIRPRNRELLIEGNKVFAEAGLPLAKLAQDTAKAGLTGLEWCIAVPGTVGGAIRGNAGAFGGEVKDTLVTACVLDSGVVKEYQNKEMDFRYRSSRIKDAKGKELVLDAWFELEQADPEDCTQRVKEMLAKKFADQPMGELCAGCLFKNIELVPGKEALAPASKGNPTEKFFDDVKKEHPEFIERGKVPAGWIIEQLGYKEKEPVNGIKVSEKHANFLVNTGEGSADAVKVYVEKIKADVNEQYGVELEEEVQFV